MGKTELILICLLAVAFLAIAARRWQLPFPILLTLGGVALAFMDFNFPDPALRRAG